MSRRGVTVLAVLGAVGLSACGSQSPAHHLTPGPGTTTRTTSSSHPHARSPELIFMRRLQLTDQQYETVEVHANGSASDGDFIGERAGVVHRYYHLDVAQLRRFRAIARRVGRIRQTPVPVVDAKLLRYTIRVEHRGLRAVQGHVPPSLRGPIAALDELINRYY